MQRLLLFIAAAAGAAPSCLLTAQRRRLRPRGRYPSSRSKNHKNWQPLLFRCAALRMQGRPSRCLVSHSRRHPGPSAPSCPSCAAPNARFAVGCTERLRAATLAVCVDILLLCGHFLAQSLCACAFFFFPICFFSCFFTSPHMCEWVIGAASVQLPTICHRGATAFPSQSSPSNSFWDPRFAFQQWRRPANASIRTHAHIDKCLPRTPTGGQTHTQRHALDNHTDARSENC